MADREVRLVLIAIATVAVAISAGSASLASSARVSTASKPPKRFGGVAADIPSGVHPRAAAAANTRLHYYDGPVLHFNRTHLVFWQPSGTSLSFDPGYKGLMEQFLRGVAADRRLPSNVYGLSGQYFDSGGHSVYDTSYDGAILDQDPLPKQVGCSEPPTAPDGWQQYCVNDSQLELELARVIRAHALPTTAEDLYFLVTPNGLGSCFYSGPGDCALGGQGYHGYCGYHSVTSNNVLYALIPYTAQPGHCESDSPRPNNNAADPSISIISHEHNELVTDPFQNAWLSSNNEEDGDLCMSQFGSAVGGSGTTAWNQVIAAHHYWLQEEWSNQEGGCQQRDETDSISIGAPAQATVRSSVAFTSSGSDPDGQISADRWWFGDGSNGTGPQPTHTYSRPGTYNILLRTTDSIGNYAYVGRTVTITRR